MDSASISSFQTAPVDADAFQLTYKEGSGLPYSPELETIQLLYNSIKTVRRNRQKPKERRLVANFDKRLQEGLTNLEKRLQLLMEPVIRCNAYSRLSLIPVVADDPFLQRSAIVQFHKEVLFSCFTELHDYVNMVHPQIGVILQAFNTITHNVFKEFPKIIAEMHKAYLMKLEELRSELEKTEQESKALLVATELLEKTALHQASKLKKARHEKRADAEAVETAVQNVKEMRAVFQSTKSTKEKKSLSPPFNLEAPQYMRSKSYRAKAKDNSPSKMVVPSHKTPQSYVAMYSEMLKSRYSSMPWADVNTPTVLSTLKNSNAVANREEKPLEGKRQASPQKFVSSRGLSLVKLKEIISEIYESKENYDNKCIESNIPIETMEQHVLTYLNIQYGLKAIITDWAHAIKVATDRYSDEDNDVLVFKKILNNEIEEQYRETANLVKEKASNTLKQVIKKSMPTKTELEITSVWNKKKTGVPLEQIEWLSVLKQMYVPEDEQALIPKVREKIGQTRYFEREKTVNILADLREPTVADPPVEFKISYVDFLRVLLEYQLRAHERFLLKFKHLFRLFDKDSNGMLERTEFVDLAKAVNPLRTKEEMIELLREVDPQEHNKITYSQCIYVLGNDIVEMEGREKGDEDN